MPLNRKKALIFNHLILIQKIKKLYQKMTLFSVKIYASIVLLLGGWQNHVHADSSVDAINDQASGDIDAQDKLDIEAD